MATCEEWLMVRYEFLAPSAGFPRTICSGIVSIEDGREILDACEWCEVSQGEFIRGAISNRLSEVQAAMDEEEACVE